MNSHDFSIFPFPLPITNNVRYSTSEERFVTSVELCTTWGNIRHIKNSIRCLKHDLCWWPEGKYLLPQRKKSLGHICHLRKNIPYFSQNILRFSTRNKIFATFAKIFATLGNVCHLKDKIRYLKNNNIGGGGNLLCACVFVNVFVRVSVHAKHREVGCDLNISS